MFNRLESCPDIVSIFWKTSSLNITPKDFHAKNCAVINLVEGHFEHICIVASSREVLPSGFFQVKMQILSSIVLNADSSERP